jgi:hypothetical protein
MFKLASVALTAALGIAAVASSQPVEAHPYVSVGIGEPIAAPSVMPAYYRPYYYVHGPYGRPGFDPYRHVHYYRHWDRC